MGTGVVVTVHRFESLGAYVDRCREFNVQDRGRGSYGNDSAWDAGVSAGEAMGLAVTGDPRLVSAQSEAVNRVAAGLANAPTMASERHFSGARVDVAAYLGGNPRCMVRRIRAPRPVRHVSVYVAGQCGADISAQNMLVRGATIVGLLEALQTQQIGVNLYVVVGTHGRTDGSCFQVIQIDSQPLDLSVASFALAHPAFARNVAYTLARSLDGFDGGSWPAIRDDAGTRKALGLEPGDIYIPAPANRDANIIKDPLTYVQNHLTQLTGDMPQ